MTLTPSWLPRFTWASILALALGGLASALTSCGGESGDDFDRAAMLSALAADVIVPTYEDYAARAVELDVAAQAFCAAPSDETLASLTSAFNAAKTPLKRAETFAIGPHTDQPLRLGPLVDAWPARTDAVDTLLASEDAVDEAGLELQGSRTKGFPAMGYLLFSPEDPVAAFAEDSRRCEYLQGMTGSMVTVASEYVRAWDLEYGEAGSGEPPFREILVAGTDPFRSLQDAASTIFESMAYVTENVRELKIGKPFGKRSDGVPQLDQLEAPYSGRSLRDAIDALEGGRRVYLGTFDGSVPEVPAGIRAWLLNRRPDGALDEQIQAEYAAAIAALEAVEPLTLGEAVTEDVDGVELAYQAIKDLQVTQLTDLAQALGVTVTFNPTDGD